MYVFPSNPWPRLMQCSTNWATETYSANVLKTAVFVEKRPSCWFTLKVWRGQPIHRSDKRLVVFLWCSVVKRDWLRVSVRAEERHRGIGRVFVNVFVCSFFGTPWTPTAQTHPLKQTPTQHTHHLCDHEWINSTWSLILSDWSYFWIPLQTLTWIQGLSNHRQFR